uniref:Uncharacterized protein n=1 Tax=Anas platyrhynchos platyrhynchos TaxID=8840 RepID=A0A493TEG2_ANAPP
MSIPFLSGWISDCHLRRALCVASGRDFLAAGLTLHYHFFLSHIAELCLPPTHPCKAKHSLLPPAPHTQAVTNLHACQLALLSRRHSLRTHPCPLSFSYILTFGWGWRPEAAEKEVGDKM